jgi:hypothetical protein
MDPDNDPWSDQQSVWGDNPKLEELIVSPASLPSPPVVAGIPIEDVLIMPILPATPIDEQVVAAESQQINSSSIKPTSLLQPKHPVVDLGPLSLGSVVSPLTNSPYSKYSHVGENFGSSSYSRMDKQLSEVQSTA